MDTSRLLTVLELASALRLPTTWLKGEANAGRIPSLRVGRRLFFNRAAVEETLLERAAKPTEGRKVDANELRVSTDADTKERQDDLAASLAMTAVDIASALQVSERTVRRLDKQGSLPRPLRISRALRWRRDEFLDWLRAGCPKHTDWRWQPVRSVSGESSVVDTDDQLKNYPKKIKKWFFSKPWSIPLWFLVVVLPALLTVLVKLELLLEWLGLFE